MRHWVLFLCILTAPEALGQGWKVAPYPNAVNRTTQPDGKKAPVGTPCEPEVWFKKGKVEWHALKGTKPPTLRLAPCVPAP